MAAAGALRFGNNLAFGNLEFPDLESRLEHYLEKIQTLTDLENLIGSLNPLIKADRFNDLEQQKLRRLRQRAYDKKRNPKFLDLVRAPDLEKSSQISKSKSPKPKKKISVKTRKIISPQENPMSPTPIHESQKINIKNKSISECFNNAFDHINLQAIFTKAPAFVAWFTASAITSYFIWHQSVALYKSAGFDNALFAATGGLLLVIGSTAYYSVSRSFIALLLCLYASGYEGYLMISGTLNDEQYTQQESVAKNPEIIFLQEKADKERATYHRYKKRYENPESKVFENGWFKKTYLDPAWQASEAAHKEFVLKQASILTAEQTPHVTWLKILYRLGLVFLCMVFVHRLFGLVIFCRVSRGCFQ